MNFSAIICLLLAVQVLAECPAKKGTSKLVCYYSKLTHVESCRCSHVVLPAGADVKDVDGVREKAKGVKILVTVNEFNQGLVDLLKSSKVDGLEINLKKLESRNDIGDFISTVRSKLGSDLYIAISVPAKAETLAKYYDFKALSKSADLFILQTAFLGASKNVTFHPSRLSGLWDMQNTDSVVDLVSGLGAPLSKLVITSPVQAFKFKLQSEEHTAPGSPALEVQSIARDELCQIMGNGGNWTLERDQDQTGPYIFSKKQWIAFDDPTSIDIKAKYSRVRGLAGMALKDLSQDGGSKCESSLLEAAYNGLSRQARAPRGAVLHSLEREILETPARPLDSVQVSPYRISRVIDVEGNVHVIRKDTRTEFECSRQGYFVHPRSCGRFYRCVKFDQLSDEFSVFEFDCPAGLAFDSRVEVCVWPGSLPHASPCSGSSEIAPVPKQRFVCPNEEGYYADPENCRWFFACLDHGKSPLSAYEFRCPFGLVYDEDRLLCEWPWLVPRCASGYAVASQVVYGGSVALDQYDGLGVLGVTALGGLHGPLQQPVAKVYSNVGLANQGAAYLNNGGLSLKAAQSLENAGLIRNSGYAVGSQINDLRYVNQLSENQGSSAFGTANQGAYAYQDASIINTGLYQGRVITNSQNLDHLANANYGTGSIVGVGVDSHSSGEYFGTANAHLVNGLADNLQYHQQAEGVAKSTEYYGNGGAAYGSGISGSTNIVGGGYSAVGVAKGVEVSNYGAGSAVIHEAQPVSVAAVTSVPTVTAVPVPGIKVASGFESFRGGVVANVPELQYKVQANAASTGFTNFSHGFVNFVSSTPSTLLREDGYHYPSPGVSFVEGVNVQPVVTAYQKPVVVSTTQTPLVEKVNVQPVSFVQHVQPVVTTYQKPVVVSTTQTPIVEKVQPVSFVQHVQPVVTTYQKPILSTPSPVIVEKVIQPVQPVVAYQKPIAVEHVGYSYPKPTIKFETPIVSTPAPVVFEKVNIQPVVTTYQKPIVVSTPAPAVLEKVHIQPVQPVVTYHQPVISTPAPTLVEKVHIQPVQPVVTYHQPVISTPAPTVVEKVNIQPVVQPVVTTYQKPIAVQNVGYSYPKPAIRFEESAVKANSRVSYQNVDVVSNVGYSYPKPAIAFEEVRTRVVPQVQVAYNVPSSTVKPVIVEQPRVYVSSTPAPEPQIKQAVSFANFETHQIVQPQIQVTSYNVPSTTIKPVVVEQPQVYVSSTPATIQKQAEIYTTYQNHAVQPQISIPVQQKVAQPVISSFSISSNSEGYKYEKPVIPFTYQQHAIPVQPVTYNYQTPVKQAVSTYSYKNVLQSAINQGYVYEKPAVAFQEGPTPVTRLNYEQRPAVYASYSYATPTVKPVVVQKPVETYSYVAPTVRPVVVQKQAPVVTSYSYTAPSTVKPILVQQQPVTSYTYEAPQKPAVVYQQQPVVTYTPQVSTVKPAVYVQQPVASYLATTPKTAIFYEKQPVVSYTPKPVITKTQFTGYSYPKPVVPFVEQPTPVVTSYENRQPVEEVPFVAKKAYVTTGNQYQYQQHYNQANIAQKTVVENYQPIYEYRQPVQQVVSTPKYEYRQQYSADSGYVYQKPVVRFEERPVVKNYQIPVTTSRPIVDYSYQKPVVSFEERPVVKNYQIPVTTSRPIVDYSYVQSTPKPTFASTIKTVVEAKQPFLYYDSRLTSTVSPLIYSTSLPVVETVSTVKPVIKYKVPVEVATVKTSRPIAKYEFSSYDTQYQPKVIENYVAPIEVPTPTREYLPVTTVKPVVTITEAPSKEYLPVRSRVKITTSRPEVTREYLPPRPRVKVTTSIPVVSREYLPVKTRVNANTDDIQIVTRRPVKVVKVSRPKTVVKVNDFHPLLSAKLGAQCTCVSNSVKLRKKPLRIVVDDDEDDDDGYVVDDDNDNSGVVVENYEYEPQKIVDITPTPEVYVKSEPEIVAPVYTIRKRVRPTTVAPVSQISEVFVKNSPSVDSLVVNAVDDLPKETVSIQSGKFDRYGPGGWRSRNEKLQGTIDCQRGGLFRHPTQCNKFYSCRWDCTKNRYTLHVFNCPVHLTFDNNLGACNWPSQGPACLENTLLPSE